MALHYTERDLFSRIKTTFPWVGCLGYDQELPARSPDLTACDFFLWGYLKMKVYAEGPPASFPILGHRIIKAVGILRREDFAGRAVNSMMEKANRCIALLGRQVEGRAGQ